MALYNIDSENDSYSFEDFVEYEDRESLRRSRQSLGISVAYVPTWTPQDGFREFFQNWFVKDNTLISKLIQSLHRKDAIIETSKLERRKFKLVIKDLNGEYTAEARYPDSGELLGYIRFVEDKGTLELTNFGAQLSRKSLDLGATSKRDKTHLAGTHGEGFKVAALVMARHGYQVRFEASSYYWSFRFGGPDDKHLYCHLTPISEKKLKKQMKANRAETSQGFPRELKANNWEDVTVRIGRLYGPQWGERIKKQQFLSWVKVAIDLDQPTRIFETLHGTLIQDELFGNKVYLKGLLLETTSSAKRFKFGYDLMEGAVNRDRQRLPDPGEEAKILAKIWEIPIREQAIGAIDDYVDMLLDKAQWGDVNRAENEISASTANMIWQYLLRRDSGKDYFYHGQDAADQVCTSLCNQSR
jgi:hypothetical protein